MNNWEIVVCGSVWVWFSHTNALRCVNISGVWSTTRKMRQKREKLLTIDWLENHFHALLLNSLGERQARQSSAAAQPPYFPLQGRALNFSFSSTAAVDELKGAPTLTLTLLNGKIVDVSLLAAARPHTHTHAVALYSQPYFASARRAGYSCASNNILLINLFPCKHQWQALWMPTIKTNNKCGREIAEMGKAIHFVYISGSQVDLVAHIRTHTY